MTTIERSSAKVLLVTTNLDVLLLSSQDPDDSNKHSYWFAVGGGIEDGESLEQAARREVLEETGFTVATVGAPVLTRHASFDVEGDHYEQDETYFVAWVERFTPSNEGWTELERRSVSGHRWWSIEELSATCDVIYPEGLAELLRSLPRPVYPG